MKIFNNLLKALEHGVYNNNTDKNELVASNISNMKSAFMYKLKSILKISIFGIINIQQYINDKIPAINARVIFDSVFLKKKLIIKGIISHPINMKILYIMLKLPTKKLSNIT